MSTLTYPSLARDVDLTRYTLPNHRSARYRTSMQPYSYKIRTECWIEQCVWDDGLSPGDAHPSFMPITAALPIPGIYRLYSTSYRHLIILNSRVQRRPRTDRNRSLRTRYRRNDVHPPFRPGHRPSKNRGLYSKDYHAFGVP